MTQNQFIDVIKALSHETRLNILATLSKNESTCVCEFQEALGIEQSSISQHLKILKQAGLITPQKKGNFIHYHIDTTQVFSALVKEAINTYVHCTR